MRLLSEKTYFYYVASVMLIVPFAEFISECFGVSGIATTIVLMVFGLIGGVIAFSYCLKYANQKYTIATDFFLSLMVFMLLSAIFTKPVVPVDIIRKELPLHFVCYYSLMLITSLITSEEYRTKLIKLFLIVAIPNSVIAILQSMGLRLMPSMSEPDRHIMENMVYGLTDHSNHFAALMVILFGAATGYFIFFAKSRKELVALLVLITINLYSLLHTFARLSWVGLIGIFITYIVSLIVLKNKDYQDKKKILNRLLIVLVIVITVFGIMLLINSQMTKDLDTAISQSDITSTSFANDRGYIWQAGIKSVPSNFMFGVGLDNYAYVFMDQYNANPDTTWVVDRAHNEFIHVLVTEGIFAVINYVFLLIVAIVVGVKKVLKNPSGNQNKITWIALTIVMGYILQSLFNSSVISVAFYFWICLGLLLTKNDKLDVNKDK